MDGNGYGDATFLHHVVAAVAAGVYPAVRFKGLDDLFAVHAGYSILYKV